MIKERHYRVGNPRGIPSWCHILRYKEPDKQEGNVLVHGQELYFYEDDIIKPPEKMRVADLQDWINRGFLVERI